MKNLILGAIVGLLIGLFIWFFFVQKEYRVELKRGASQVTVAPTTLISPTSSIIPTTIVSPTTEPVTDQFSNWLTYKNETYNYQLKYDPTWFINKSNPSSIILQGDIKQKGWPSITIVKTTFSAGSIDDLKNQVEALFTTTTSKVTFGNNIAGVLMETAASPQAYATQSYYFISGGSVLSVGLNDTAASEGKPIYQNFLANFETL